MPGFLRDPVLVFGFQDCLPGGDTSVLRRRLRHVRLWVAARRQGVVGAVVDRFGRDVPAAYRQATLQEILRAHGATSVETLDAFDSRADLRHDMNTPIGPEMLERYKTVIDIGSLEHVFDTRQCLANLFSMVKTGGHILLHVPCNGYCDHGFHTFSPDCITGALECNGFQIRYLKISSKDGFEVASPTVAQHSILWVVARKLKATQGFSIPQQQGWKRLYDDVPTGCK